MDSKSIGKTEIITAIKSEFQKFHDLFEKDIKQIVTNTNKIISIIETNSNEQAKNQHIQVSPEN